MGDIGSLAIGAGLAALCLLMNLDLLLPIIGGLFVIETLSVMIQVISFRVFHRRVFRMAPDPPPLRAGGLAGDDRDRPLLDPRRPVHRPRPRHLLRRLPIVAMSDDRSVGRRSDGDDRRWKRTHTGWRAPPPSAARARRIAAPDHMTPVRSRAAWPIDRDARR